MKLLVDPYKHQPDSPEKGARHTADIELLANFFDVSEEDVVAYSGTFEARPAMLLRFILAMKFWAYSHGELKESARTLPVVTSIFVIEGVVAVGRNKARVVGFLRRYLTREEKIELLTGYAFSKTRTLTEDRSETRHLMFENVSSDHRYMSYEMPYCTVDISALAPVCMCSEWLKEQPSSAVDGFMDELSSRLYQMRSAVVHGASPVTFGYPVSEIPDGADQMAHWSMTVVDAFMGDSIYDFQSYESGFSITQLTSLIKRALFRYFKDDGKAMPSEVVARTLND